MPDGFLRNEKGRARAARPFLVAQNFGGQFTRVGTGPFGAVERSRLATSPGDSAQTPSQRDPENYLAMHKPTPQPATASNAYT